VPLKPHPTDPDKMVYVSRQYDLPQRPWVDLTPQDYAEIFRTARNVDHAARLATAKLKEKNNG